MLAAFVLAAFLASTPALAAEDEDGFVSIFNGRNLDGWVVVGDPAGFSVVDGCLHSDGGKGGVMIRTEREYANFVLRLEWMLSETGNSGVLPRLTLDGRGHLEVQLLAPWTPYRDDLHCTGSLYGHVPANPRPDETTLRWRTLEITAVRKRVTAAVDGVRTSEGDYDEVQSMRGLPLSGHIALQDSHTGPGEWVRFRNIRVKDLDRDSTFVAEGIRCEDITLRRMAYSAAIDLGAPMTDSLLDVVAGDSPGQARAAAFTLSRIASDASRTGAAAMEDALLARLARPGPNAAPDLALAARLLGVLGTAEGRAVEVLTNVRARGGPVGEAAAEALQRLAEVSRRP